MKTKRKRKRSHTNGNQFGPRVTKGTQRTRGPGCGFWLIVAGVRSKRTPGCGFRGLRGLEVVVGIGFAGIFWNLPVAVIGWGGGGGVWPRCDELVWSGPMA
jgi:hypothetical protein